MQKLTYEVRFVTPAFLGGADQSAQWRPPPFKALLRQWWRVVHGPKVNYNVNSLRRDEVLMFGSASDDTGAASGKSKVLLRLSQWKEGGMKTWQGCGTVFHQEVGQGGRDVGADLYLGYGPLSFERGQGTVLGTVRDTGVQRTAIEPETEKAELTIVVPDELEEEIRLAMQLSAWFGTLGSRSRNGWGALQIIPKTSTPAIPELTRPALNGLTRNLGQCFDLDWPHAIGSDEKGPLVWRTAPKASWREVMKELAKIKIAFRTSGFPFPNGNPDGRFNDRHLLAYPVTNHKVTLWLDEYGKDTKRLANQVRFKVVKEYDDGYQGVIVHLPCALPGDLASKPGSLPNKQKQLDIWKKVHGFLDVFSNGLSRL